MPTRRLALACLLFAVAGCATTYSTPSVAGAERRPAQLVRLSRDDFDAWARQHPEAALRVMNNLAMVGARRLAATTRQLRAVLE